MDIRQQLALHIIEHPVLERIEATSGAFGQWHFQPGQDLVSLYRHNLGSVAARLLTGIRIEGPPKILGRCGLKIAGRQVRDRLDPERGIFAFRLEPPMLLTRGEHHSVILTCNEPFDPPRHWRIEIDMIGWEISQARLAEVKRELADSLREPHVVVRADDTCPINCVLDVIAGLPARSKLASIAVCRYDDAATIGGNVIAAIRAARRE